MGLFAGGVKGRVTRQEEAPAQNGSISYSAGRKRRMRAQYSLANPGKSEWFPPSSPRYQLLQPELHAVYFMRFWMPRLYRS